jgi:SPP1 family predicted phage head-tail adaptor
MRPGELRHYIAIEEPTEAVSAGGDVTQTWAVFAQVHARIETIGGGEAWAARQVYPTATTLMGIRYLEGLTNRMRVSFGGRLFDINAIDPDAAEGERWMVLTCTENPQ